MCQVGGPKIYRIMDFIVDCFRLNTVLLRKKIFSYPFKISTRKLACNYGEPRLQSRGAGGPDTDLSHRKRTQNLCIVGLISDRRWYQGQTSMLFNGRRGSVLGVEQPKREVNHSHPSCTEVKNECSYTPRTPSLISLHDLRRENFTFTPFHLEACTEFELCTLFLRLIVACSLR